MVFNRGNSFHHNSVLFVWCQIITSWKNVTPTWWSSNICFFQKIQVMCLQLFVWMARQKIILGLILSIPQLQLHAALMFTLFDFELWQGLWLSQQEVSPESVTSSHLIWKMSFLQCRHSSVFLSCRGESGCWDVTQMTRFLRILYFVGRTLPHVTLKVQTVF